jgi:hypothetical protein
VSGARSLTRSRARARARTTKHPRARRAPAAEPWEQRAGKVIRHVSANPDCEAAFRNYVCFMNFPRCDAAGNSLILCRSVCQNFFKACNYPKDMWRCGSFAYYGGDGPEPASNIDNNGAPIFARAMFPGQPFRDNQGELPVCTPALADGVARGELARGVALAAAVLAALAAAR